MTTVANVNPIAVAALAEAFRVKLYNTTSGQDFTASAVA